MSPPVLFQTIHPGQFPGRPSTSSWGFFADPAGVIMLGNCGVRACLPVKIRNAKSFPVFKSKGKILTSDTGFLSFNYCKGTREVPWKAPQKKAGFPSRVLPPTPAPQQTGQASGWLLGELFRPFLPPPFCQSGSGEPGVKAGRRGPAPRASAARGSRSTWHMFKGKEPSF